MPKTELQKLEDGEWYRVDDPGVAARKVNSAALCQQFNAIPEDEPERQSAKAHEIFGSAGRNLVVHSRLNVDYGKNIHVGDNFLANYNLTVLDIAPVTIGNNVWIGPDTDIYTVNHPLTAAGRRQCLGIGRPVTIGDDVWIGGHSTICPGVTIGNGVVVAAGAVVTTDVPDNVVVGGVPARILKKIDQDGGLDGNRK